MGEADAAEHGVVLHLDAESSRWKVGGKVHLGLHFENTSRAPVFLSIGAGQDGAGCAFLSGAGLCCEAPSLTGARKRLQARVTVQRERPEANIREHALYLPPQRSVRIPLHGEVIAVGPELVLRLAGCKESLETGHQGEVLLPLRPGEGENTLYAVLTCHPVVYEGQFGLCSALEGPIVWQGPHEPSRPPAPKAFFVGQLVSNTVVVAIKRGDAAGAPSKSSARSQSTKRRRYKSCSSAHCVSAKGALRNAAASVAAGMSKTHPLVRKCKEPEPGETSGAPELPRLAPNAPTFTDSDVIMYEARMKAKNTPRGPAHGTTWRNVARSQDPLADARLLEMVEAISELHSPGAVVAFCDSRAGNRTGQRFIGTVQAIGASTKRFTTPQKLAEWMEMPRGSGHQSVLIVCGWHSVHGCLDAVERAEQYGFSVSLCGVVILCEPREERHAKTLTFGTPLSCPMRVLPSLAF